MHDCVPTISRRDVVLSDKCRQRLTDRHGVSGLSLLGAVLYRSYGLEVQPGRAAFLLHRLFWVLDLNLSARVLPHADPSAVS